MFCHTLYLRVSCDSRSNCQLILKKALVIGIFNGDALFLLWIIYCSLILGSVSLHTDKYR